MASNWMNGASGRYGFGLVAVFAIGVGAVVPVMTEGHAPARSASAAAAQTATSVTLHGVIRAANGSTVEGVAVSARAMGKTFTTTVFSDEQGRYVFPPLDDGRYHLWAQAVGFDRPSAELMLARFSENNSRPQPTISGLVRLQG